jgi:hypothetical protein
VRPTKDLIQPANHEDRIGTRARPQTVETLIREAGRILANHSVSISRSKVSSLVRSYVRKAQPCGHSFAAFIAANVPMHAAQRRSVAEDLRWLTWSGFDPTAKDAVANVTGDGF